MAAQSRLKAMTNHDLFLAYTLNLLITTTKVNVGQEPSFHGPTDCG